MKINGIAWADEGPREGVPVILIHGFPFNRSMWAPQLAVLSKVRRTLSYDVRGHGQSEVGDGQYSIELFVDDLISGMDQLKIERAVLCGLSMGGYIGLRAVERHPDRFKALVLCDTKSEADTNEAKIKRMANIRSIKNVGVEEFSKVFAKSVLGEASQNSKPELVKTVSAMIAGNTVLGICGSLLALAARTDTTAALEKMTLPTLILVGEKDTLTPPSASEAMKKKISNAVMHIIPGAGHLSNLENPTEFNQKLLAFLK